MKLQLQYFIHHAKSRGSRQKLKLNAKSKSWQCYQTLQKRVKNMQQRNNMAPHYHTSAPPTGRQLYCNAIRYYIRYATHASLSSIMEPTSEKLGKLTSKSFAIVLQAQDQNPISLSLFLSNHFLDKLPMDMPAIFIS